MRVKPHVKQWADKHLNLYYKIRKNKINLESVDLGALRVVAPFNGSGDVFRRFVGAVSVHRSYGVALPLHLAEQPVAVAGPQYQVRQSVNLQGKKKKKINTKNKNHLKKNKKKQKQ